MNTNETYYTVEISAPQMDTLHWGTFGWQSDHLSENGCIFDSIEAAQSAATEAGDSRLYPAPDGYSEIRVVKKDTE